jgi:short-subunit dehydrogenase
MIYRTNHFGKLALITGGTSGIGAELAKLFVRDGCNVVLVSNDPDELVQHTKSILKQINDKVNIYTEKCDLSDDDDHVRIELVDKIMNQYGITVHYLVNNAGFGMIGEFHEMNWKKQRSMILVNVLAVAHMAHLFINAAKRSTKNEQFRILNTSSMVSMHPVPLFSTYSATKAFVRFLSQAITVELDKYNITCTTLLPGATRTPFLKKSRYDKISWFEGVHKSSPEHVAKTGYYHMMTGKPLSIPGFISSILYTLMSYSPPTLTMPIFYISNQIK